MGKSEFSDVSVVEEIIFDEESEMDQPMNGVAVEEPMGVAKEKLLPQNLEKIVLGNTYASSAEKARAELPILKNQITKLLEVQSLLSDTDCTRTMFDEAVKTV